jgi:hypothetical protein
LTPTARLMEVYAPAAIVRLPWSAPSILPITIKCNLLLTPTGLLMEG